MSRKADTLAPAEISAGALVFVRHKNPHVPDSSHNWIWTVLSSDHRCVILEQQGIANNSYMGARLTAWHRDYDFYPADLHYRQLCNGGHLLGNNAPFGRKTSGPPEDQIPIEVR